jgi:hypothetical protein
MGFEDENIGVNIGGQNDADSWQASLRERQGRLREEHGEEAAIPEEVLDELDASADELLDAVEEMRDDYGEAGAELEKQVLDTAIRYISEVDEFNYETLVESFEIYVDETVEQLEQLNVSPEFGQIAEIIGLDPEAMADYWQAYLRAEEGERMDLNSMSSWMRKLNKALTSFEDRSEEMDEGFKQMVLCDGFAVLINNQPDKVQEVIKAYELQVTKLEIERLQDKNTVILDEIEGLEAKIERWSSLIQEQQVDIEEEIEKGYGSRDKEKQGIMWKKYMEFWDKRQQHLASLSIKKESINENMAKIVEVNYRTMMESPDVSRAESDRYLLEMSRTLKDSMSEKMQGEVEAARDRVLSEDGLSSFERNYYEGFYGPAMSVAGGDIRESENEEEKTEAQQNFLGALQANPVIPSIAEKMQQVMHEMQPMQEIFIAAAEGKRTDSTVGGLKAKAAKLKALYGELDGLVNSNEAAGLFIELERTLPKIEDDEAFYEPVKNAYDFLDQANNVFYQQFVFGATGGERGADIEGLCDMILSTDFDDQSLHHIAQKAAIFIGAIAAGVGACIVMPPLGLSGVSLMALNAVVMSGAGLATVEVMSLGFDAMDSAGIMSSGVDSRLGNLARGDMGAGDVGRLAATYALEWGFGAATTFAFMGAGRILAAKIGAGASSNTIVWSRLARYTRDAVKRVRWAFDRVPKGGGAAGAYVREVQQEMFEELAESALDGVHPALGGAMTLINSMSGMNVEMDMGSGVGVTTIYQSTDADHRSDMLSRFHYNEGSQQSLIAKLNEYEGFVQIREIDGNVECLIQGKVKKNGITRSHKMIFVPTSESYSMRRTFRESLGFGQTPAQSLMTKDYGVSYDAESDQYTYENLKPGPTKASLLGYLKGNGYVIAKPSSDGTFIARKGDEVIEFKAASSNGEVEAELVQMETRDRSLITEIGIDENAPEDQSLLPSMPASPQRDMYSEEEASVGVDAQEKSRFNLEFNEYVQNLAPLPSLKAADFLGRMILDTQRGVNVAQSQLQEKTGFEFSDPSSVTEQDIRMAIEALHQRAGLLPSVENSDVDKLILGEEINFARPDGSRIVGQITRVKGDKVFFTGRDTLSESMKVNQGFLMEHMLTLKRNSQEIQPLPVEVMSKEDIQRVIDNGIDGIPKGVLTDSQITQLREITASQKGMDIDMVYGEFMHSIIDPEQITGMEVEIINDEGEVRRLVFTGKRGPLGSGLHNHDGWEADLYDGSRKISTFNSFIEPRGRLALSSFRVNRFLTHPHIARVYNVVSTFEKFTFDPSGNHLPPIEFEGEFEPDQEYKRISEMEDGPTKDAAKAEFKQRLGEQLDMVAKTPEMVRSYLEGNPDANLTEVLEHVYGNRRHKFSIEQRKEISEKVFDFMSKRKAAKYYVEAYKGREKEFAATVFEVEEEALPGNVEVELRGFVLFFNFSDPKAYELVSGGFLSGSAGFATPRSGISELKGCITAGNNLRGYGKESTIVHEVRHQENKLIFSSAERADINDPTLRAKDEILAYLRDGTPRIFTQRYLTEKNGLYDYFEHSRKGALAELAEARKSGNPDILRVANQNLRDVNRQWGEHCNNVKRMLDTAYSLGVENIEILSVTEAEHWDKLGSQKAEAFVGPFEYMVNKLNSDLDDIFNVVGPKLKALSSLLDRISKEMNSFTAKLQRISDFSVLGRGNKALNKLEAVRAKAEDAIRIIKKVDAMNRTAIENPNPNTIIAGERISLRRPDGTMMEGYIDKIDGETAYFSGIDTNKAGIRNIEPYSFEYLLGLKKGSRTRTRTSA